MDGQFVVGQTLFRYHGVCSSPTSDYGDVEFDVVTSQFDTYQTGLASGPWSITGTINNTTEKEYICPFESELTIGDAEVPYSISTTIVDTTCGQNNGSANIVVFTSNEQLQQDLLGNSAFI